MALWVMGSRGGKSCDVLPLNVSQPDRLSKATFYIKSNISHRYEIRISSNLIGASGSSDWISVTMQNRKPELNADARRTPIPKMLIDNNTWRDII